MACELLHIAHTPTDVTTLRAARVMNVRRPEWLLQPVMPTSR